MAKGRGVNKGKGRNINIDMTGVETSTLVAEGDYLVEVEEVTAEESESSGKKYLKWKLSIAEGDSSGQKLYHNTSLQPQALFNLKGVLIALGMAVPNSAMKLNLDEIIGLTMGVTVEHEVYDGKKRARIVDVFPWDGADGGDEDDVNLDDMDLSELLEFAKESDIDLSGLSAKDKKSENKVRAFIEKALDESEEEEEGDDDEGDEDDEEEVDLDELELPELLQYAKDNEIDLSELTTKAKKNKAKVKAAIEAALAEAGDDEGDDDEGDEDDEEEVDLDTMTLPELIQLAKDQEVDLSGLSVKDKKNIVKVRKVIAEALSEEE